MRHTFRFNKQDSVTSETSRQCSDGGGGSEMSERSKLQRHKAQSRKTFKFRMTRKEMRKLKTTSEPCETTESTLEMQPTSSVGSAGNGAGSDLSRGNTIILNPALHSAAANLTGSAGAAVNRLVRGSRTSKKPPALVLTKDSMASTLPSGSSNGPPPPHSATSSIYGGTSPGWKVTFPDIEIHSPKDIHPDNASISSRGTSSTVGYRDSFGEADEGGVLSLQERYGTTSSTGGVVVGPGAAAAVASGSVTASSNTSRPSSVSSSLADQQSAASRPPSSSGTLIATPSSSSTNSSVVLQTARDNYSSTQARRRNYIIFEQNDEDTLI